MTENNNVVSFDDEHSDLPSFNVDMFPNVAKAFILNVADASQTPIDASCMATLSIWSAALAKKYVIQPFPEGAMTVHNNIYAVSLLPSGERKSAIHNLFVKPILDFEKSKGQRAIEPNELEDDSKTSLPRYIADDVTPEKLVGLLKENNERMAILSSEGGLFEALDGRRYGNTPNLDVYLKGYTGDYLRVDRIGRPTEILYAPILTINLFVQPTVLQGLPNRLADRGIFGRFLYSKPRSMKGHRDVTPKRIDSELQQRFNNMITAMLSFEPDEPITLNLDGEAQRLFLAFMEQHERELKDDSDVFSTWMERLPAHLLKIASLLHVAEATKQGNVRFESISRLISLATMTKVLASEAYFKEHAKAAFGCIKSDEDLEDAKYLWKVFLRERAATPLAAAFTKQFIWQKTKGKFNRMEHLDNALRILVHRSYIMFDYQKGDTPDEIRSGRKPVSLRINSKALNDNTPSDNKSKAKNESKTKQPRAPQEVPVGAKR